MLVPYVKYSNQGVVERSIYSTRGKNYSVLTKTFSMEVREIKYYNFKNVGIRKIPLIQFLTNHCPRL